MRRLLVLVRLLAVLAYMFVMSAMQDSPSLNHALDGDPLPPAITAPANPV